MKKYDAWIVWGAPDGKPDAQSIYNRLSRKKRIYIDSVVDLPREFLPEYQDILDSCHVVVLAISANWLKECKDSYGFMRELIRMAHSQNIGMIPVAPSHLLMTRESLPDDIAYLANIEVVEDNKNYYQAVIEKLSKRIDNEIRQAGEVPSISKRNVI